MRINVILGPHGKTWCVPTIITHGRKKEFHICVQISAMHELVADIRPGDYRVFYCEYGLLPLGNTTLTHSAKSPVTVCRHMMRRDPVSPVP